MNNWVYTIVFIGLGLFSIAGAIFNWDWYFENRRARIFVSLFGRMGARIFYVILGVFLICMSFYATQR